MRGKRNEAIAPPRRLSPIVRLQRRLTAGALSKLLRRRAPAPAGPAVMAHVPLLSPAYGLLETALLRARAVDPRLAELARVRAATIHGCPW